MPLLSRIFGWTPPDNAEYIEVLLPCQTPTCHSPTNPRKSNHISSAATELNASLSSISPHQPDQQGGLASLSLIIGGNKHTDPTRVARPCNKFILFRCDYVRKHSRDGKHVRRGLGSETEKSLSKQAAEAWRLLSNEERLHWKERAVGERLEHARRYPDYRYRPKKGPLVRRRHVRSSNNDPEATSSTCKTIAPPSGGRSPPEHMLSVIKPTPRKSSYVPCSIGDLSNKSSVSLPSMAGGSSSPNIRNIGSPYNQYTPSSMSLPSRLQIPMASPSFNTPELLYQNSVLTNRRPSISTSSSTSSLSYWNGENMDYLCGSGSASDVSMSDGISLSNFDIGIETAAPAADINTGTNQSVMHEYITGDTPPPSSLHHQQQQQQLFDNVYQANLWNIYPIDGGAQMAIASQVDSNATTHAYAPHTIHGYPHAPTLASSTPSIPNGFYETVALAFAEGPSNSGHEHLFAMGF